MKTINYMVKRVRPVFELLRWRFLLSLLLLGFWSQFGQAQPFTGYGNGLSPTPGAGIVFTDETRANMGSATAGSWIEGYTDLTGAFVSLDVVLIIDMQTCTGGQNWEFNTYEPALGDPVNSLRFTHPLQFTYVNAQVIKVNQYPGFSLNTGTTLTCSPYDPILNTGGVLSFLVNGMLTFAGGTIDANYKGYPFGIPGTGGAGGMGGLRGDNGNSSNGQNGATWIVNFGGQGIGGAGEGGHYGGAGGSGTASTSQVCCGCTSAPALNLSSPSSPDRRLLIGAPGLCGNGGNGGRGAGGAGGATGMCGNSSTLYGPDVNGKEGGSGGNGGDGGRGGGVVLIKVKDSNITSGLPISSLGENGSNSLQGGPGLQGGIATQGWGGGGGDGADGGDGGDAGNGGAGGVIKIYSPIAISVSNTAISSGGTGLGSGGAAGPKGVNADLSGTNFIGCPPGNPANEFFCACEDVWNYMHNATKSYVSGPIGALNEMTYHYDKLLVSRCVVKAFDGGLSITCTDNVTSSVFHCDMVQDPTGIINPDACLGALAFPSSVTLPDPDFGNCNLSCPASIHYVAGCCQGPPQQILRREPIPGIPGAPGNDGSDGGPGSADSEIEPDCPIIASGPLHLCTGESVTLFAVPGGTSYVWTGPNGGGTSQSLTVDKVDFGTYCVTVTFPGGATCIACIDVTDPDPVPVISTSGATAFCNGGSVTLSTPILYTGYDWSGPSGNGSNPTFTVTQGGTYDLTVTDDYGCTGTASIYVEGDDVAPVISCNANINVNTDPGFCGATVSFPNPVAFDNCPGVTVTQILGDPSASLFPVGITEIGFVAIDAASNQQSCSFFITVTDNSPPVVSCGGNISVSLDGNGTATINPSQVGTATDDCGMASITLSTASFTCAEVGPNTVVLTATDVWGNQANCSATVTIADMNPPVVICQNISIHLQSSGSATISASQIDAGSSDNCGIAALTVNQNTFDCSNQGNNSVILTATDVNANASTCNADVTVTTDPLLLNVTPFTFSCGYNVSCFGASDGSAGVSVLGGCLPYSYLWDNSQTTTIANNLMAGNHFVTVTDANGNSNSISFTITEPAKLVSSATIPVFSCGYNLSCGAACDGQIDLTVSGGCPPYSYFWSNSSTIEDQSNLCQGSYTVIIIDANGCTDSRSFTLTGPDPVTVSTCNDQSVTFGYAPLESALLTATTTGGCPPYTYTWDNGGGNGQSVVVRPAFTTTYTVTVTDANGCISSDQMIVTVVNVRCGNALEKVSMCDNGITKCVKKDEVYKKIALGWSVGPCNQPLDFSGGDCGDPDYLSCKCTGGIEEICFTYTGLPDEEILMYEDPAHHFLLGHFTGVMPGDEICVANGPGNPIKGVNVSLVKKGTTVMVKGGCKDIKVGNIYGDLTISSFRDVSGATCNAQAPPICDCSGKITDLLLTYAGPNGANVKVYKSHNHTNMIWSGNGLNTNAQINLSNPAGLPGKIYVETVGSGQADEVIDVKCDALFISDRYGFFEVTAYTSQNSGSCPAGVMKSEETSAASTEALDQILLYAFPNPFSNSTTIRFSLPSESNVSLEVMDIFGRVVANLFEGNLPIGESKEIEFSRGTESAGIYFVRIVSEQGEKKMLKLVMVD